jgi:hypothetical protein
MEIRVLRCPDDQLGALSCRCKLRRMAIFSQFFFVLLISRLDLPHGGKNRFFRFIRSKLT